jgi:hypothetical protein
MIAVDTVEIQAHNEAEELACCFICTTNDQRYTLEQIEEAFRSQFDPLGNAFVPYMDYSDRMNERDIAVEWERFVEAMRGSRHEWRARCRNYHAVTG